MNEDDDYDDYEDDYEDDYDDDYLCPCLVYLLFCD